MRCELYQMDRMELDERFGSFEAETMRRNMDIRRRMRLEKKEMEEEQNEALGDLSGD